MAIDVAMMLNNLSQEVPFLMRLVSATAWFMGVMFTASALYELKVYGMGVSMVAQSSMKKPITYLIVAAALFYLPTSLSIVMVSAFGYDNPLAYTQFPASRGHISQWFESLLRLVQLVGLIAFVRGWVMIARASGQGGQPGQMGKAMVHILGGVFAFNIVGTARVLANTFGVSF